MGRMARSCIQSLVKIVNSVMTMIGLAMILYGLWMFRNWRKHLGPTPYSDLPTPWFICSFLGTGAILCLITCIGHIAADTINGCCLYFYMVFVFLFLMIEAAITTDVLLNHNWEEDFPVDPSGYFDNFTDFVSDNFDMCKLIGLSVVAIQVITLLLSMILKAMGPHRERYYESDDDYYTPDRVPILRHYVPPPNYSVNDPQYGPKNDAWNIRINNNKAYR